MSQALHNLSDVDGRKDPSHFPYSKDDSSRIIFPARLDIDSQRLFVSWGFKPVKGGILGIWIHP
jgi:hypothetical protein